MIDGCVHGAQKPQCKYQYNLDLRYHDDSGLRCSEAVQGSKVLLVSYYSWAGPLLINL